MKIAFGGGGTGGHIVPALAVAKEVSQQGHYVYFIGNADSIESRLADADGYPFRNIKVKKLYRSLNPQNLLFPYYLVSAVITAVKILKQEGTDAVFCTGGFVSGPVSIAALLFRIPLFCHESNSYPGLVTRTLSRYYKRIYISFETSRKYLPSAKLSNFGIPIKLPQSDSFTPESIGLNKSKSILMISGGSQGSLAINQAVDLALPELLNRGYQVVWQTGSTTYDTFADKHHSVPGLHLFAFSPDLPRMLKFVDIAITRAGAMTIAELEENRIPAILIPLPSAAENHQYYNALEQQEKGVAFLLEQSHLNSSSLLDSLDIVACNLDDYKVKLNSIPPNQAALNISRDFLEQITEEKP